MSGKLARLLELVLVLAGAGLPAWWVLEPQRVPWPAALYAAMSLLAFGVYHLDKRRASEGGRRVPEAALHLIELLGGWPGALVAQQILRHKTSKTSYRVVFWLIVLVHAGLWGVWMLLKRG